MIYSNEWGGDLTNILINIRPSRIMVSPSYRVNRTARFRNENGFLFERSKNIGLAGVQRSLYSYVDDPGPTDTFAN